MRLRTPCIAPPYSPDDLHLPDQEKSSVAFSFPPDDDPHEVFKSHLLGIADKCRAQLRALRSEGKTGTATTLTGRDALIVSLHSIWAKSGGRGKGSYYEAGPKKPEGSTGPFLHFVALILCRSDRKAVKMEGLRKRIDNLIPNRK